MSNAAAMPIVSLSNQQKKARDSLLTFLHERRTSTGFTHTGISDVWKGSYTIRDDENEALFNRIAECVKVGIVPSLTECPRGDGFIPLLVDLDITVPTDSKPDEHVWESVDVSEFIKILNKVYRRLLDIPVNKTLDFVVLARPEGYFKGDVFKDGLHIQCQQLWAHHTHHLAVKRLTIALIQQDMSEGNNLGGISMFAADGVWDESILSGKQNWFLLGCGKHGYEPYKPYAHYKASFDPEKENPSIINTYEYSVFFDNGFLKNNIAFLSQRIPPSTIFAPKEDIEEILNLSKNGVADEEAGESTPEDKVLSETQWADITKLVNLLSAARAEINGAKKGDPEGCCQVIQVLGALGNQNAQSYELAEAFSLRSVKHRDDPTTFDWIKGRFRASLKYHGHKTSKTLVEALIKWAKEDNLEAFKTEFPKGVQSFDNRTTTKSISEVPTVKEIETLVNEITILSNDGEKKLGDGGFVDSRFLFGTGDKAELAAFDSLDAFGFPDERKTTLIKSHLGTGKTELFMEMAGLKGYDDNFVFQRILFVTGRRTFTKSMVSEFNKHGLGFQSYLDEQFMGAFTLVQPGQREPDWKHKNFRATQRLFIQVESLNRLPDAKGALLDGTEKKLPFIPYDLVVLDEIETIASSLRPWQQSGEERKKFPENLQVFHNLVATAHVVVAGDAFLTDRSRILLRSIRPDHTHQILDNHFNPYGERDQNRTLVRVCVMAHVPTTGGGAHKTKEEKLSEPKENKQASIGEFFHRITNDLDDGKRLVIVVSSKKAGRKYEEDVTIGLKQRVLKSKILRSAVLLQRLWRWMKWNPKTSELAQWRKNFDVAFYSKAIRRNVPKVFTYRFYHADMPDKTQRERDLRDVEKAWANVDLLMYTPTITVGINYNPKDKNGKPLKYLWFDRLYIYALNRGATARDLFQASLRCRTLKDSRLYFVLDDRLPTPPFCGLERTKQVIQEQSEINAQAIAEVLRRQGLLDVEQAKRQGWDFFNEMKSAILPKWFHELFIRTCNEENVNGTFSTQVYNYYLKACGYTELPSESFDGQNDVPTPLAAAPAYHDVKYIKEEKAQHISEAKKSDHMNVSEEDRAALNKFYFHKRFSLPLEFPFIPHGISSIRETPTYLQQLSDLWPTVPTSVRTGEFLSTPAKQEKDVTYNLTYDAPAWATQENLDILWRGLPPCPTDCPENHLHRKSTEPKGFLHSGNLEKFSNISLEKLARRNLDAALATAATDDFRYGFGDLRYARKGRSAKHYLILELTKILGLSHSCLGKSWSFEEWKKIHVELSKVQTWPETMVRSDETKFSKDHKTSSFLALLSVVFMLRDRKDGEVQPHRDEIHSFKDVSRVLDAWCLSELKSTMASPGKTSVRAASEAAGNKLDWNEFQKKFKEDAIAEKKSDWLTLNKKGLQSLNEEGTLMMKQRYQEAKDALNLPADFKANKTLEQKFSVQLIPYLDVYEPVGPDDEEPRTGLLWFALPERTPYQVGGEIEIEVE
jgi:hypothetical protein